MERTTLEKALTSGTVPSTEPRRRWSDGPNYRWSPGTDDTWSVATHWPALVAVLCEQVAESTRALSGEMDRLATDGRLSHDEAISMRRTVHGLRESGVALQQIVRLGSGMHNLSPDRIDIAALARAAVRERQHDLLQRGDEVSLDLHRAEVWVDGSIATALMQASLDWALGFSNHVRMKVEPGDGTEHARLVVRGTLSRSREAGGMRRNRRMNDNLQWVLIRQLAACARLPVSRSSTAATEAAVIEFPATITVAPRHLP